MSNWKVGPGGRLYHPTTGAYVGQLDDNGNEQMVVSAFPSGSGVRFVAPSGTVAADGTITLGTALPATFGGGLWLYLPAGAIVSGSAGWYWADMSSTTVGVVRGSQGGAALVGSATAYTGVTAEVVIATTQIDNVHSGMASRIKVQGVCNNTANAKTYRCRIGTVGGVQVNSAGPTSNKGFAPETCIQSIGGGLVVAGASGVTGGTNTTEIVQVSDESVLVYHTLQLSVATDCAGIVSITQTLE